jgi:thiosulfate/3-mercaptopyruvate sulfurtransferase
MVRSYDDMISNLEKKTVQVVDARPNEDFTGIADSKVPDGKLGHIPFAKNIPQQDMINKSTGLLKSNEEVLDIFGKNNVDLKQPVVLHCLSSVTACTVLLAAHECGYKDIPLYTGSWFEWSQRATEENCIKD